MAVETPTDANAGNAAFMRNCTENQFDWMAKETDATAQIESGENGKREGTRVIGGKKRSEKGSRDARGVPQVPLALCVGCHAVVSYLVAVDLVVAVGLVCFSSLHDFTSLRGTATATATGAAKGALFVKAKEDRRNRDGDTQNHTATKATFSHFQTSKRRIEAAPGAGNGKPCFKTKPCFCRRRSNERLLQ